ncbi:hypothetical protein DPEC_G00103370 [Dallia pectoralis]|uniref:Uncharacterized protein n=1 Tax=Dallia pectoralis TaxID=75939 RepID=A0ACC2GXA8_DALPE|nr:hypothetical protein DPEC_G00103370 [Dallia pectoralis]
MDKCQRQERERGSYISANQANQGGPDPRYQVNRQPAGGAMWTARLLLLASLFGPAALGKHCMDTVPAPGYMFAHQHVHICTALSHLEPDKERRGNQGEHGNAHGGNVGAERP